MTMLRGGPKLDARLILRQADWLTRTNRFHAMSGYSMPPSRNDPARKKAHTL
jgi:hypothetical protein